MGRLTEREPMPSTRDNLKAAARARIARPGADADAAYDSALDAYIADGRPSATAEEIAGIFRELGDENGR